MSIRLFTQPGAFEPEALRAISEAFEAAVKELQHTGQTEVTQEAIARRIITAATLGERDPVRLLAAALARQEGKQQS